VIQFNFVDISLGIACPSSLVIFEKNKAKDTLKKVEALFNCPTFARDSVALSRTELKASNLEMSVIRNNNGNEFQVKIDSKEA